MARTDSTSGFGIEVFVEKNERLPRVIRRVSAVAAVAGAPSILILEKERRQPAVKLARDLLEREKMVRAHRAFDAQVAVEEVIVSLECLDQQIVERKPHRSAPVRVSAEEMRISLSGT